MNRVCRQNFFYFSMGNLVMSFRWLTRYAGNFEQQERVHFGFRALGLKYG